MRARNARRRDGRLFDHDRDGAAGLSAEPGAAGGLGCSPVDSQPVMITAGQVHELAGLAQLADKER